ncbi:30S ribosomal protein S18 [Mycobacterium sp. ENV421]|nr:30S ribosomal protein S18 [Mycobacterium sp. ENV421]
MVKAKTRNRRPAAEVKPRRNTLTGMGLREVDYKDTATLRVFISERGKIRSRRVTGLTVRQQRQVATAIKNAREMALLPYPGST